LSSAESSSTRLKERARLAEIFIARHDNPARHKKALNKAARGHKNAHALFERQAICEAGRIRANPGPGFIKIFSPPALKRRLFYATVFIMGSSLQPRASLRRIFR
jgi:hypothetical protein